MMPPHEDPPPFGGTWMRLYGIVILELIALIISLYAITRVFS